MTWAQETIKWLGPLGPWAMLAVFIASSLLIIWGLEHMTQTGVEGTVLGTLVMPYCSGMGNLIFVFVILNSKLSGSEVMTNCLVNNVTNMTLLIGLPTVLWGMAIVPPGKLGSKNKSKKNVEDQRVNRLALLLTLTAVLFFTGAVWAFSLDRKVDFREGLVLVGLFLFWQCFHVFDVLKTNVRKNKSLSWILALDFLLLLAGAYGTYISTDALVYWISNIPSGFISAKYLGWLSGWLMVLPNGLLALYYGWQGRPEVVYTSQVGDGHICIPLCTGLYALFKPLVVPPVFEPSIHILVGATLVHLFFVGVFGHLPRFMGWILIGAYGYFLYEGLFD